MRSESEPRTEAPLLVLRLESMCVRPGPGLNHGALILHIGICPERTGWQGPNGQKAPQNPLQCSTRFAQIWGQATRTAVVVLKRVTKPHQRDSCTEVGVRSTGRSATSSGKTRAAPVVPPPSMKALVVRRIATQRIRDSAAIRVRTPGGAVAMLPAAGAAEAAKSLVWDTCLVGSGT